jgi:hypothetical protein
VGAALEQLLMFPDIFTLGLGNEQGYRTREFTKRRSGDPRTSECFPWSCA